MANARKKTGKSARKSKLSARKARVVSKKSEKKAENTGAMSGPSLMEFLFGPNPKKEAKSSGSPKVVPPADFKISERFPELMTRYVKGPALSAVEMAAFNEEVKAIIDAMERPMSYEAFSRLQKDLTDIFTSLQPAGIKSFETFGDIVRYWDKKKAEEKSAMSLVVVDPDGERTTFVTRDPKALEEMLKTRPIGTVLPASEMQNLDDREGSDFVTMLKRIGYEAGPTILNLAGLEFRRERREPVANAAQPSPADAAGRILEDFRVWIPNANGGGHTKLVIPIGFTEETRASKVIRILQSLPPGTYFGNTSYKNLFFNGAAQWLATHAGYTLIDGAFRKRYPNTLLAQQAGVKAEVPLLDPSKMSPEAKAALEKSQASIAKGYAGVEAGDAGDLFAGARPAPAEAQVTTTAAKPPQPTTAPSSLDHTKLTAVDWEVADRNFANAVLNAHRLREEGYTRDVDLIWAAIHRERTQILEDLDKLTTELHGRKPGEPDGFGVATISHPIAKALRRRLLSNPWKD